MDLLVFANIFNPFISLTLRVNDKRPSSAVENENTIISWKRVSWQTMLLPIPNLYFLRKNSLQKIILWNRHWDLLAFLFPMVDHLVSILGCERPDVCNWCRSKKDVTQEWFFIFDKLGHIDFPSFGFSCQTTHKLLCSDKLNCGNLFLLLKGLWFS